MRAVIAISCYYLCNYCAYDCWKRTKTFHEWSCHKGESERKVMVDHHGRDGKRYDEQTDVCEHYKPREGGVCTERT